jgi:large subunit ribosomal protein L15
MAVHMRKKNSRQRGSKTHGWGSMKKHRGAGHRGGRGMAGTGKRCDSKKPMIWGDLKYFGKHGFKKKNIKVIIKPITIRIVEQKLNAWTNKNLIEEKAGTYNIELKRLGYNKLLSNGKVTNKEAPEAKPEASETKED